MSKLAIKLWKNEDRRDWQGYLEEYPNYWMSARTRRELVAKLTELNRKFESGEVTPAFTHEHDNDYWATQPDERRRRAASEMFQLCAGEDFWKRRIENVLEVVDANGKVLKRIRGQRVRQPSQSTSR
ncbi:MAG: hypothetical protein ACKV2Q_10880 [Planctomycetaceae bacterium]